MGVGGDMMRAAANIVVKPLKAYRREAKHSHSDLSNTGSEVAFSPRGQVSQAPISPNMLLNKPDRSCMTLTETMVVASASGVGDFFKYHASGMITIPFAFTEGLRNIPHLYGEETRDYGVIHDWKSGLVVAGKALTFGVYDGVTGVFILPYKGAKNEGPLGMVKGMGKGVAGLTSKAFTGTLNSPSISLNPYWETAR